MHRCLHFEVDLINALVFRLPSRTRSFPFSFPYPRPRVLPYMAYMDVPLDRVWFSPLCPKQGVYFLICLKQGPKMEDVVLHRVGILGLFLS